VKLLLDTQAFVWFGLGDARLSAPALAAINDPANEKFVSPASYWEIAIKINLGKFALNDSYDAFMQRTIAGNGFRILAIDWQHTSLLTSLPLHHRDPFDRLLVAQSLTENMPLISSDARLDQYGIQRIW
jgi:PIN domain nuclease of toxin-antitoxin system